MHDYVKIATEFGLTGFLKKKYVFLPVNGADHWSLVIICHTTGPIFGHERCTYLLHLDSLKVTHDSEAIFKRVAKLLRAAWTSELGGSSVEEEVKLLRKRMSILR